MPAQIPPTILAHYAPHNYTPWFLPANFIYTYLGLPANTIAALQSSIRNPVNKVETSVGGPANRQVLKRIRDVQALTLQPEIVGKISSILTESVEITIGHKLSPCNSYGFFQYDSPSGHYDWHSDSGHVRAGKLSHNYPCRRVTLVYYPNSDYQGGELELAFSGTGNTTDRVPLTRIKPKTDHMLIFPSDIRYPHRVLPVTQGTRFAIVNWFDIVG